MATRTTAPRYTDVRILKIVRDRGARAGLVILAFLFLVAVAGPAIPGIEPDAQSLRQRLQPPSATFLLGTDELGRDMLSRLIHGARLSLLVGVVSVGIGLVGGTAVGLVGGYAGGSIDNVLMRLIDVMLAFPGVLLAIAIAGILGPGLFNVMVAVGISSIPLFARVSRSSVLALRQREFVVAASALGQSHLYIMLRHILPNALPSVMVLATMRMATAILAAASLSFLGLGAQPPTAEWGAMLNASRQYLRTAWWVGVFPGAAITLTVLAFNLLGDAVRDALDPRLSS